MKTGVVLSLIFLVLIGMLGLVCAEIRINEVELNPNDACNDCTEWLELYSDSEINLTSWRIMDASGKNHSLNFSLNGYLILENLNISLNNADEQLFLYNESTLIHNTTIISDSSNDNQTWQHCSGNWSFRNSTRGAENNCTPQTPTCTPSFSCSNSSCISSSFTQTCYNITSSCQSINTTQTFSCVSESADTYIQLNWTDKIFSDEEFDIEVDAQNLLSYNYDLKVWIEFKTNSTMLSERFDSSEDEWKSGTYYINNFFIGPGNRTKDVKLRMKEDYQNLDEEVYIYAKLRRSDNEAIIDDLSRTIPLSKSEASSGTASDTSNTNETQTTLTANAINSEEEQIIILGSSESKTTEKFANSIIYKSKMEYIKDYMPYALSAICIVVIIFLMLDKTRRKE